MKPAFMSLNNVVRVPFPMNTAPEGIVARVPLNEARAAASGLDRSF